MHHNPYPGPRAFRRDDESHFHGRRAETRILSSLVVARRTSLLFAASGAGKSSLIRAGLVPDLTRPREVGRGARRRTVQKMLVLPVTGVGGGLPPSTLGRARNVFSYATLEDLMAGEREGRAPESLLDLDLATGVARLVNDATEGATSAERLSVLLVIDQFEELFTRHGGDRQQRAGYFQQLAELQRQQPRLHVLLSMREDYIAELTPYAKLLPGGLRDRFRLEKLTPEAALEAVVKPAEAAGCPFAEGVAEELLKKLRKRGAGSPEVLRETVEPVHLQIVCHQLWNALPSDHKEIGSEDVKDFGDVDEALRAWFEQTLKDTLADETVLSRSISERGLRRWFTESGLITPAGTRGLVLRDGKRQETEGLANAAVDVLAGRHLINEVRRGDNRWYELASDRLIDPIRGSDREWRLLHTDPVTIGAAVWQAEDEDPSKLWSGRQLEEARVRLEREPDYYNELEKRFLRESARKEKERLELEEAERVRRRRQLKVAVGVAAVMAVMAVLAIVSLSLALRRERELADSLAKNYWIEGQRRLTGGDQLEGLGWIAAAAGHARDQQLAQRLRRHLDVERPRIALLAILDIGELHEGQSRVPLSGVTWHKDGRDFAVWDRNGKAQLWKVLPGSLPPLEGSLVRADLEQGSDDPLNFIGARFGSDDGRLLLWATDDHIVIRGPGGGDRRVRVLFDLADQRVRIEAVSFDADGENLIALDERHCVWRLKPTRADVFRLGSSRCNREVSAAEDRAASFTSDGSRVLLWPREGAEPPRVEVRAVECREEFNEEGFAVCRLGREELWRTEDESWTYATFGGGGDHVLTAAADGRVALWEIAAPMDAAPLVHRLAHEGEVRGVALVSGAAEGERARLLSVDENGAARLWALDEGTVIRLQQGRRGTSPSAPEPPPLPVEVLESGEHMGEAWPVNLKRGHLVTWSVDGSVALWARDTADGEWKLVDKILHDESQSFDPQVLDALPDPSEELLVTRDSDRLAKLSRVRGGKFETVDLEVAVEQTRWVDGGLSPHLLTVGGGVVIEWSVEASPSGLRLFSRGQLEHEACLGAAVSNNGLWTLTWGEESVVLWDRATSVRLAEVNLAANLRDLGVDSRIEKASFSPEDRQSVVWTEAGIFVWQLAGDLDHPADYPSTAPALEVAALTGVELSPDTRQAQPLARKRWLDLARRYWRDADHHYEGCRHRSQGVVTRFLPQAVQKR